MISLTPLKKLLLRCEKCLNEESADSYKKESAGRVIMKLMLTI